MRNLSLAGQIKVAMISALLKRRSHDVEVISQGEVIERGFRFYHAFREAEPFDAKIPVYYSSALPLKFVNGLWSSLSLCRILKARHRESPFDLVLIYNLKVPQIVCANYAIRRLNIPVVLEYEDGAFVDRKGERKAGLKEMLYRCEAKRLLMSISGCFAVSPSLLFQTPSAIPKMLLRGVVGDEICDAVAEQRPRRNWVVFSGTHYKTFGLEQLIHAWKKMDLPEWELHIAGYGNITGRLRALAQNEANIVFHGLLNRKENARLLSSAKIGINPHDVSSSPGNVFPVKIIEYLAAGTHVITTPLGAVEPELEAGITYMADNRPDTIETTIRRVIHDGRCTDTAMGAAQGTYGSMAVANGLDSLIRRVMKKPEEIEDKDGE